MPFAVGPGWKAIVGIQYGPRLEPASLAGNGGADAIADAAGGTLRGSPASPPAPAQPGDVPVLQAEEGRAMLDRLQQVVAEAERPYQEESQASGLLEANRKLVMAALHAQSEAERYARALHQVLHSAEHDALTGLPNRLALHARFAQAVASAKRRGRRMALLFLDLNGFKQVNDSLGHAFGDEVLRFAARRLAESIREADTVCRYGGDEFLVLLTDMEDATDAELVAGKILAALDTPGRVADRELRLSASIGISVYPEHGTGIDALIEHADAAMYRAKRRGRGGYAVHAETTRRPAIGRGAVLPRLARRLTARMRSLASREQLIAQLREGNEQLRAAAAGAGQVQDAALVAQQQQMGFMNLLAHQLRNPLAPIRTATELLTRVPPQELPRLQAIIERQVGHLARMVGDLLEMSRASMGKLKLESVPVDLSQVLLESAHSCRPVMERRQQRFIVKVAPHLPIEGDPIRLGKIFCNLLNNASKFTPEGGEIILSAAAVGESAVVAVSDSGVGISAETLPAIFEPFVRDKDAAAFDGEGLGIGLTAVRDLVEAHDGTVTAESAGSGLGSRFVVTLALRPDVVADDGGRATPRA